MIKFLNIVLLVLLCINCNAQTKTWTRYSDGLPVEGVMSLVNIGTVIFAGTDKGGVFKSTDGGINWIAMPAHNTLKNSSTWSLASIDTFLFAAQRGGGVLKTSLNGKSWTVKNSGLLNKILQDIIAIDSTLYVATYGGGIYYSTDLAESWKVFDNNDGMEDHKVYALAHNSNYIYAGTAGINSLPDTGVAYWKSLTGGSWNRVNKGFIRNGAHLDSVFSLDANDSLVYAGTDDVGMYRTNDNGENWKQIDSYTGDIHAIKIAGQNVYYGTSWAGVHSSFDNGKTWAPNNNGLKYGNASIPYLVKDFLVMDTLIYAATDIGVFRQTLPEVITSTKEQPISYTKKAYLNNYPNPFKEGTTIKYYLPQAQDIELTVFDFTGKEVFKTKKNNESAGNHSIYFRSENSNAGIYLIKLQTKDGLLLNKMLKADHE